ncbi:MAG TPA: D-2-hydroxyacid dehydrogenase [Clostridia bacterium]|nr:D-2-hydroxyacid dehydrogenase [Clostridia bacterium]
MLNILVAVPVDEGHKKRLHEASKGNPIVYIDKEKATKELIENADVIFGNVDPKLLVHAKKLKLLQLLTAGTDGYIGALPEGATLCNTTGAFSLAISEHLLAMLLMLLKRMHQYRDNQNKALWRDMGNVRSVEDLTVLVLGMGDIGGAFAKKVKALGAYVIGVRRTNAEKPPYADEVYANLSDGDLDKLITRADVIALAMPNTGETRGIMDKLRISMMKKDAILLNVGRGNAVDTEALTDAVEKYGILCGLDVTDPEPLPATHRLWKMENALITPHVSGFFHLKQTHDNMVNIAAQNIERLLGGIELTNVVDLSTGYRRIEQ